MRTALARIARLFTRTDPGTYVVTWQDAEGRAYCRAGTFRECDALMHDLLVGGTAVEIVGYRPDGHEDTFLFPATHREDYPVWVGVPAA